MLSFLYEQRLCSFFQLRRLCIHRSCLPQITKFIENRFFAQTPSPIVRIVTFVMEIGHLNVGWYCIRMYNITAV